MTTMKLNFPGGRLGTVTNDGTPSGSSEGSLVVLLHGMGRSEQHLDGIAARLAAENTDMSQAPDATPEPLETWVPHLPFGGIRGIFSFKKAGAIVDGLADDLDTLWAKGNYKSIKIVGHSVGGIYARALVLKGAEKRCDWAIAREDSRLVLLAAVNRGAGPTRHMGIRKVIGIWLFMAMAGFLAAFSDRLHMNLLSAARGSEFITKLRLNWLDATQEFNLPTTVQLLGSEDDVVGPDDSLDLITGSNFHYLDVENSGHLSILDVHTDPIESTTGLRTDPVDANRRWEMIKLALFGNEQEISNHEIRPWELEQRNDTPVTTSSKRKQVVFVVHGIRDEGYWTDKIARRIWKIAGRPTDGSLDKVVDSYGFFGMGPFLFARNRRIKVQWFMERYMEARAKSPNASFHFVGHSHGTYVLAKALELYEKCRFENVVFAGSVVRADYQWKDRIAAGQVRRVLNFEATEDWVVAFFPRLFDMFNLQDMGGAGHVGFREADATGPIYSIKYAIGSYSAARQEVLWDEIAEFILAENDAPLPRTLTELANGQANQKKKLSPKKYGIRPWLVSVFSNLNILVYFLIFALVFAFVPAAIYRFIGPGIASIYYSASNAASEPISILLFFLAITILTVMLVFSQRKYARPFGAVRTMIGVTLIGLAISGAIGLFSRTIYLFDGVMAAVAAKGTIEAKKVVTVGQAQEIADLAVLSTASTAVTMVAWLVVVVFVLRKI